MTESTGYTITSLKDYNKLLKSGKVTQDDFYEAFFQYAGQFEGAAEEMTKNWSGFTQVLKNTKDVVASSLLGPTLNVFADFGANALAYFKENFVDEGQLEEIGQTLGRNIQAGLFAIVEALQLPFAPSMFEDGSNDFFGDFEDMRPEDMPIYQTIMKLSEILRSDGPFIIQTLKNIGLAFTVMRVGSGIISILLNPMTLLIGLFIAGAAAIAAYQTNFMGFRDTVNEFVAGALLQLQTFITNIIAKFTEWINGSTTLAATIRNVAEVVSNWAYIVGQVATPILQALGAMIKTFVVPALKLAWSIVKTGIRLVLSLANLAFQALMVAIRVSGGLFRNYLLPAFKKIWSFLKTRLQPVFDRQKEKFDKVSKAIQKIIGWVEKFMGKIRRLANQLANLRLPDWLTPGSPTPFEIGLRGINKEVAKANRVLSAGPLGNMGSGGLRTGINQNSILINVNGAGDPEAVATAVSKKLAGELRAQGMSYAHI
jgi:hypothetical protein